MTARELYAAYIRGHHITQIEGSANHDLLMMPVLLGCYRDIYYKRIRGTEKTSTQRKLSADIRKALNALTAREYWGMTADEIGVLCDYMDSVTDVLGCSIMGLQRAMSNFYEGYDDKRRDIISWCATAHSMAYVISAMRRKLFVKVENHDIEIDRQRTNAKVDLLDKYILLYANTFDNRPDDIFSPEGVKGVERATKDFMDAVIEFVNSDLDKEIKQAL